MFGHSGLCFYFRIHNIQYFLYVKSQMEDGVMLNVEDVLVMVGDVASALIQDMGESRQN